MADPAHVIEHPNRQKASSRTTKAVVVALLAVSATVVAVVTVGGWATLEGAQALQISYIVLYAAIAVFVARWNRGLLPVASALAIVLAIFAAVSGPQWLDRDREGFTDPALDSSVLGLLTLALVPLQVLLIAFALRGFRQAWNVEVERPARPDRAARRPAGARAG